MSIVCLIADETSFPFSLCRIQIVDDDVGLKSLAAGDSDVDIEEYFQENKPTVAEFIDERPLELQQLERFRENIKWKLMNKDEGQYRF